MTIQMKLIIAGVIFTILMVLIHPVPESARQKREKEKAMRADPLMGKIEDYNKDPMHKLHMHSYVPPSGNVETFKTTIGTGDNPYVSAYSKGNPNAAQQGFSKIYNSDEDAAPAPATAPAYNQPQYPTAAQPDPASQGYYPPPPMPANSNTQQMNLQPHSENDHFLSNGKQVVYAGVYVYKIDDNGVQKPMPDGDYKTDYGVPLHVRDGKKFVINNN